MRLFQEGGLSLTALMDLSVGSGIKIQKFIKKKTREYLAIVREMIERIGYYMRTAEIR